MASKIQGLTLTIGADTTALIDALKGVNKNAKDLQGELKDVENLLKLDPTNTELLAQKEKLLADSIANAKDKLDTLKTAAEQAQEKLANGDIGDGQFRALQREVIKAEQNLKKLTDTQSDFKSKADDISGEIDDISGSLDDMSDNLGDASDNLDDMNGSMGNASDKTLGFGDVLGANVVANGLSAIAGMAKDAAGELAELAIQTDSTSGMLQAKLGLTSDEADKLTDAAKSIWKEGFGDSISDVANDLATVRQYLGDVSDDDMQSVLEKAYTMRDVFGADVPDSLKSVRTMMNNFKISSDDAFDVITKGYQNGLDFSGEFLDTLNEYSPQFEAMGISAEDALNLLKNGADNGAFSLDKVADAAKEFNIRIKDGSTATAEGLGLLGLNIDDITQKLADGSMSTSDAMKLVIDALENTNDKVIQNQAGVDLFGTQWEDTTSQVILSLNDTQDAIGDVTGAAEEAGNAARDNIGVKFEQTVRKLKEALEPIASLLLDIANVLLTYGPEIAAVLGTIAAGAIWTHLGGLPGILLGLSGGLDALGVALAAIGGPVTLIIAAIAAAVVALVHLFNTNQEFHDKVIEIWNGIKDFFTQTIPEIVNNIVTWFAELPTKVGGAVSGVITSLGEWVTNIITWIGEAVPKAIDAIVNFFAELPSKIGYAIGFIIGTLIKWHLDVINWVITEVPKIIESVLKFFAELPGKVFDAIIALITKLGEWETSLAVWIKTEVPKIIDSVLTFFSELPTKIYNAISNVIEKIAQWKNDMINKVKLEIPKVISTITDFFEELPGKMLDIGANIVKGLWDGIKEWANWLGTQISGFTDGIVQGIKDTLGIHSPSKVMADEIGKFIPLGLAKGINDFAYTVSDSVKSLATSIPKNFESNINYSATSSLSNDFSKSLGDIMGSVKTALSSVRDVVSNDFASQVSYAAASSSDDYVSNVPSVETEPITAEDIANIISVALLEGLNYVGDRIFDALPKGVTMNLDGAKFATAEWDSFDDVANKKRRMFSPSRNEIYDIALQAARSITG